jgi:hypothetical protein
LKGLPMALRLSSKLALAALAATSTVLFCGSAAAADKVKVGFVSTLSGPSAALGVDIRDAFLLAVKMNGGKLGGLPAEVIVSDDQFKPDVAKQLFEKNVEARQGRLHDRRGLLEHHARGAARGARQRHDLPEPERRAVVDGGQGLQQELLRRRLAERRVPRGGRPVRERSAA